MILTEIKKHLIENKSISLADLSNRFRVEPDAMRGMLNQWIKKGNVIEISMKDKCSNCCGDCNSGHLEFYEWNGKEN